MELLPPGYDLVNLHLTNDWSTVLPGQPHLRAATKRLLVLHF